jgi:hypothetical protein
MSKEHQHPSGPSARRRPARGRRADLAKRLRPSQEAPASRDWRTLHAVIQLLLYALVAGLSPVAFAAAIAVMPAGRLKTIGFGIAFVLAQSLTCSPLVIVGVAATGSSRKSHPDLHAGLELVLAAVLVWLAAWQIGRLQPRESARVRACGNCSSGWAGCASSPRCWRACFSGSAARSASSSRRSPPPRSAQPALHGSGEGALIVLYTVIASVLVWGPVILFVFLGDRTVALMKRAQEEVARRQPHVTVYALLLIAALLTLDAIGVLL